jgi:hypothetical protein
MKAQKKEFGSSQLPAIDIFLPSSALSAITE